jgi:hypothetical protein
MRSFGVDTLCNTLFQISSNRVMQGSVGIIRDTQNCIHYPGPSLVYPTDTRWTYLQGFGFNYDYYRWVSGDLLETLDETTYPYIKLGNCVIGSKTVLSVTHETEAENSVMVFPIPTNDRIHIRFPAHQQHTIEVFDMTGKKVYTKQSAAAETTIDVSALSPGSYVVRVSTVDKVYVKKIIVEN